MNGHYDGNENVSYNRKEISRQKYGAADVNLYAADIRAFEEALSADESDDPLDLWLSYIEWRKEKLTTANSSTLIQVYEACARRLINRTQYRNDVRYIRVWAAFADSCQNPIIVYQYMNDEEIGTELAFFYEKWASACRAYGNEQDAALVIDLGVNRKARPMNRLLRKTPVPKQPPGNGRHICNSEFIGGQNAHLSALLVPRQGDGSVTVEEISPEELRAMQPKYRYDPETTVQFSKYGNTVQERSHTIEGHKHSRSCSHQHVHDLRANNTLNDDCEDQPGVTRAYMQYKRTNGKPDDGRHVEESGDKVVNPTKKSQLHSPSNSNARSFKSAHEQPYSPNSYISSTMRNPRVDTQNSRIMLSKATNHNNSFLSHMGITQTPSATVAEGLADARLMTFRQCLSDEQSHVLHSTPTSADESGLGSLANTSISDFSPLSDASPGYMNTHVGLSSSPADSHAHTQKDGQNAEEVKQPNQSSTHSLHDCHHGYIDKTDLSKGCTNPNRSLTHINEKQGFNDHISREALTNEANINANPIRPALGKAAEISKQKKDTSMKAEAHPNLRPTVESCDTKTERPLVSTFNSLHINNHSQGERTTNVSSHSSQYTQLSHSPSIKNPQPRPRPRPQQLVDDNKVKTVQDNVFEFGPYSSQSLIEHTPDKQRTISSPIHPSSLIPNSTTSLGLDLHDPFEEKNIAKCLSLVSLNMEHVYRMPDVKAPRITDGKGNVKMEVTLADSITYRLKRCVGKGAWASVYLVEIIDIHLQKIRSYAIKVTSQAVGEWEAYISDTLHNRKAMLSIEYPHLCTQVFGRTRGLHVYSGSSIVVLDYLDQGSLLDAVNAWAQDGSCMKEELVMFYTIEILRILEIVHACDILHGDLKPDNFLLRASPSIPQSKWQRHGNDEWQKYGLQLIDYGRSLDCQLYPSDALFTGSNNTDGFICVEMQHNRPWRYQVDTYGILGIIHCMFHNQYMDVVRGRDGLFKPRQPFKRWWHVDIWTELFNALLNADDTTPASSTSRPDLTRHRHRLEEALEEPQVARKLNDQLRLQAHLLDKYRTQMGKKLYR
eukprot:CFRG4185T1